MKTSHSGINFALPEVITDKGISVIYVGPYDEQALAEELNRFFGTQISALSRVNSYILVHEPGLMGLEKLVSGKPFVDPVIHRASLNEPLAMQLGLPFDYVLQSNLRKGTSDAEGDTALRQALLALGREPVEGDIGFLSREYYLRGELLPGQLEAVSQFLANPELNDRMVLSRGDYENGVRAFAPIVTLKPDITVRTIGMRGLSDGELLALNNDKRLLALAGTLEELKQFRDMYEDESFLAERKKYGLPDQPTDVEICTWFGIRSEHCFHKEFNARIELDDLAGDPVFSMAARRGWLKQDKPGHYILERGMFRTFVEEPAMRIYKKLEKRGKNWIASMFEDNSGVVLYDEDYMFCIKIETHNSPSNKEPVQGAKTGIDGVNRDIFGTMRGTFLAIANLFYYLTGHPEYRGWLPKGVKYPYVLLKGVTRGVKEGSNESQIATVLGGVITDPRYIAKVLVYCGTVGWSPVRSGDGRSYIGKSPKAGDLVFIAGQPVGIDGIGGATQSSLVAGQHISLGHVQADFSFIQAKLQRYLLEVAREHLLASVTDCGAMGLGSASHETARETGGLDIDLSLHPLKYAGIQPWQINCSETQDRMLLVANPKYSEELMQRARLHDVQLTELGKLTETGYIHLRYKNRTVALIPIEKLFDKEPRKKMHARWLQKAEAKEAIVKGHYSLEESLCMVMSQPDVASREWFFRQKDSGVKGATIQGPLIGMKQEVEADATIQKPLDTEGRDFGAIAYALGIAPKLSDIDPYLSAQKSFIDMVGKIVAVGGALPDMKKPGFDSWAVCGNYCQPNSDGNTTLTREIGEHNLASLIREGIGVREAIEKTNIPVISGKDSMKCSCEYQVADDFSLDALPLDLRRHVTLGSREVEEEAEGRKVKVMRKFIEIDDPDTYLVSGAVKIEDYRKCVSSALKQEGDLIYVVGKTRNHIGASQYLQAVGYKENGAPIEGGAAPRADLDEFVRNAGLLHKAIDSEVVASCSYIYDGGILAALSKAALAGGKGAFINHDRICREGDFSFDEEALFSEAPGRFIVTVAPEDSERFEAIMGNSCRLIGEVSFKDLKVYGGRHIYEEISLANVKEAYQRPLRFGLRKGA